MRNDGRVLIGRIAQLKQAVQLAPDGALWDHGLPNLGGDPSRVEAAEAALGVRFDDQHRDLLAAADGWPHMFQHIDLLSTTDLAGGPRMAMAREMLLAMGSEPLDEAGGGTDLLPIATTSEDRDLFVMLVDGGRAGLGCSGSRGHWWSGSPMSRTCCSPSSACTRRARARPSDSGTRRGEPVDGPPAPATSYLPRDRAAAKG